MPIAIERSEFPIVVARYRGAPSVSEFETYLAGLSEVYRAGRQFALVFDSRGAESPPATHRKLQADWMREYELPIRNLNVGTAFVMDSVLLRGALTAILWLQPLPCPHLVCAEIGEAMTWARTRWDGATARSPGR